MTDLYFAYGSNMSSARLRARIEGATSLGRARIADHRLVCNKAGKDGSGKANLVRAPAQEAWGVVFRIARADWPLLDRCEWGYRRVVRSVTSESDDALEVQLYLARPPLGEPPPPFEWYRAHMLDGALEHHLPESYVAAIRTWAVRPDEDAG